MDTAQISCCLSRVKSFLGVFPSDVLPSAEITNHCSIIVNVDASTQPGSHWLAIRFEPRSTQAYYFDSYGLPRFIPIMQSFLRHNCCFLHCNETAFQGLTCTVCGKYCCLFTLFTDRGYTAQQFVRLLNPRIADLQVESLFVDEFDSSRDVIRGGKCSRGRL
jgi:hypothetical protein